MRKEKKREKRGEEKKIKARNDLPPSVMHLGTTGGLNGTVNIEPTGKVWGGSERDGETIDPPFLLRARARMKNGVLRGRGGLKER